MMQVFALDGLLFLCLLLLHYSKAEDIVLSHCNNSRNYTSGSAYAKNLNLTLSSLSANASLTGFSFTVLGQNPDVVYGLVQCTNGISSQDCQTCAQTSAQSIIQLCPNQKEASIHYDSCLMEYSESNFYSVMNSAPIVCLYNLENVTNPTVFNSELGNLMRSLLASAASSPSRSAVGSTNFTDFSNIYAMLQCTRDLGPNSCLRCLQDIVTVIPDCCAGKQGGQVISWSCRLRFEIYSFFELPSPPPPPPPPPLPPPPQMNSTISGTTNSTSHGGKKSASRIAFVTVIPLVCASVLISTICICFLWRKAKRRNTDVFCEDGSSSSSNMESLQMDLGTLKVATSNFLDANKLGEGGFGPVYKGKLSDGREIAVKRLASNSMQGLGELRTEVVLVAKLLHRNLVKLLGFCLEEEEKLLVYEYLPNGSLDKILFDERRRQCFGWEQRYKIIIGIARGLLYLHEDSQLRVIHRDLKASNVLLDEHMNPKISDFGLAKLFRGSQTQGNTNHIAGTYGYMAPEYAKNGLFSTKSDVYSFGILALEIVTGRKNSRFRDYANLQSHTWQHWSRGTGLEVVDPSLGGQWPRYEVLKCIHIALLCVQEAAGGRPTMSEIVLMLNSYTATSLVPSRPAFFVPTPSFRLALGSESLQFERDSKSDSSRQTVNEVTISELIPR
ncbi:cysteine-rich receptor-like protein kinase 10 isoform X2 [Actinidia eriantha]|uniref:cysteine-rich receptor-like protein kinase 10 isoform X2 n=1 Tax=Actinidia eriantha TaxID=165200 RepID=UPI0025898553|nr:cysteine-rich receptor-like protein kinase 10 isoform X2 [Actinidia eriantha]